MSNIPADLLYPTDDEWVKVDGETAVVGLTDHAQDSLSDIVFLELPDTGDEFDAEDSFGTVESVKAAADLLMPVSGEVTAVNEDLIDEPEKLNSDPYGSWLIKISIADASELDNLMNAQAYTAHLAE
jgi:glycine cleavage system H protein